MCALYIVAVIAVVTASGAPFVYPLDDAYIHLAMGRTIATSGVWGVSPADPAAASSSPLWTLLMAGAYGLSSGAGFQSLPLLLNTIAGCCLLILLLKIFRRQPTSLALAAATAYAAALPSLSALGMEHVLHGLLAGTLCFTACQTIVETPENTSCKSFGAIGLLAGFSVAARYESLFLVAPLIALSAARLRWRVAVALGVGAASPVLGFGLFWIHNGGWLLPNSLLLKTGLVEQDGGLIPALEIALEKSG